MKFLFSGAIALSLAGCVLPSTDMASNRYSDVAPEPPNSQYVGFWTGTNGPYLMTLRIDADGRGVSCSSWNGKDSLSNIKLASDTAYFQDGTRMALTYADSLIIGKPPYTGSSEVRLAQDNNLVEASPYCTEKLQKPYL